MVIHRRHFLRLCGIAGIGTLAGCNNSSGDDGTAYHQVKLVADGDSHDQFGQSVAVSSDGTTAIIGAFTDEDPNGRYGGAAYVFSL